MDNWVLKGPRTLENVLQCETAISAGQVKVKVTHVLLSNYDALCFTGDKKVTYPKTIGRFAIGVITEVGADCYGVTKGARVYLSATRACGECFECKSGNSADCTEIKLACRDFDGFLRDFVVCDYRDVCVIPDSVDDLHALCIENVALAEHVFDKLALPAGSKIAVVGAGFLGSIIAEVALYHKLVPIVVDNYQDNLERVKRSGAFYAFEADDNLVDNVADATSGSMCDAAVYTSCCRLTSSIPASILARGKDLVLGGFCTVNFLMNAEPLFDKNLRIYSISDGYGYAETAINMIVHGAINLEPFEKEVLSEFNPSELLLQRFEAIAHTAKMTVLKLII